MSDSDDEKDVVVTYETLFEMLRIEKTREELQQLDDNFFDDVLVYLKRKKNTYETSNGSTSLFETDEKEKARLEMENIKKILKDLYDRREKKIMHMAINKARTGVSVINTANMLPSEIMLFDAMNTTLLEFRKNILFRLVCGDCPAVSTLPDTVISKLNSSLAENHLHSLSDGRGDGSPDFDQDKVSKEVPPELESEISFENPMGDSVPSEGDDLTGLYDNEGFGKNDDLSGFEKHSTGALEGEPKELKTSPDSGESASAFKKVRFLAPIDEIVGPDLQIYGPYDVGAIISLPNELARVLVEKEQAEEA